MVFKQKQVAEDESATLHLERKIQELLASDRKNAAALARIEQMLLQLHQPDVAESGEVSASRGQDTRFQARYTSAPAVTTWQPVIRPLRAFDYERSLSSPPLQ